MIAKHTHSHALPLPLLRNGCACPQASLTFQQRCQLSKSEQFDDVQIMDLAPVTAAAAAAVVVVVVVVVVVLVMIVMMVMVAKGRQVKARWGEG